MHFFMYIKVGEERNFLNGKSYSPLSPLIQTREKFNFDLGGEEKRFEKPSSSLNG